MVQYAILIYTSEVEYNKMTPEQQQADFQEYFAFGDKLRERGVKYSGEPLMETTKATTVRIRDGKTLVTDGPFAETKEQLAGFYLVEANDLEHAIEIAALVPGAKYGSIEIRPLVVIPTRNAEAARDQMHG
jgi:hypothetical protein